MRERERFTDWPDRADNIIMIGYREQNHEWVEGVPRRSCLERGQRRASFVAVFKMWILLVTVLMSFHAAMASSASAGSQIMPAFTSMRKQILMEHAKELGVSVRRQSVTPKRKSCTTWRPSAEIAVDCQEAWSRRFAEQFQNTTSPSFQITDPPLATSVSTCEPQGNQALPDFHSMRITE